MEVRIGHRAHVVLDRNHAFKERLIKELATQKFANICFIEGPRSARNDLRITFLDVGQGDAAVIETPRGHVITIDAGGKLERGTTAEGGSVTTTQKIVARRTTQTASRGNAKSATMAGGDWSRLNGKRAHDLPLRLSFFALNF